MKKQRGAKDKQARLARLNVRMTNELIFHHERLQVSGQRVMKRLMNPLLGICQALGHLGKGSLSRGVSFADPGRHEG